MAELHPIESQRRHITAWARSQSGPNGWPKPRLLGGRAPAHEPTYGIDGRSQSYLGAHLVLHDSQCDPASVGKFPIDAGIALDVGNDLRRPEFAALLRYSSAFGAPVPETTVDEYGHAGS